jgi:hypothetical protein
VNGRRDRAHLRICAELGLDEPMLVHTDYSGEAGSQAVRTLLSGSRRPTAIVFDNDIIAVAGLSVAHELGLDVPGELSLVAWDDSQPTQVVRPALTALNRDIPAYGTHASRTLLTLIEQGWAAGVEDTPARLIPRGSTARARASPRHPSWRTGPDTRPAGVSRGRGCDPVPRQGPGRRGHLQQLLARPRSMGQPGLDDEAQGAVVARLTVGLPVM